MRLLAHGSLRSITGWSGKRWWMLFGLMALGLAGSGWCPADAAEKSAEAELADLTGRVQTADGSPVPDAAVVISAARPRSVGPALLSYNYPDCLKYAFTDAAGRFEIKGVRRDLLFRLLVRHPGYGHEFCNDLDPRGDRPTVTLAESKLKTIPGDANLVVGRVVGPDGQNVAGAIVRPRGYMEGDSGLEGPMDAIAETTVTDAEGRFTIASTKRVTALHLVVHARGFASEFFSDIAAGGGEQFIHLRRGFAVRGRVVHQGRPLADVVVGACWSQRMSGSWFGPWQTITDAEGRFALSNLTPGPEFCVYAEMNSVLPLGAPPQVVLNGAEGDDFDLGEMTIAAGHTLSGRVSVSESGSLPPDMFVCVVRDRPYDQTRQPVAPDGTFEIRNLPGEVLAVHVRSYKPGTDDVVFPWPFHLSPENDSLDLNNPQQLLGLLQGDAEVHILLDRGPFEPRREPLPDAIGVFERLRRSPLRGVDPVQK